MGAYIPSTKKQQEDMLQSIGFQSMDDLLTQIPEEVRIKDELHIPHGMSQFEVSTLIQSMAKENKVFDSIYRGAGAYAHFIPSIVKQISLKEEFLTAYTPYQPEISQGTLQAIYEYQTMICELTGMDVSNASVYDGSTAAAEAVVMCLEKKKRRFLISKGMNPEIIKTVETILGNSSIILDYIEVLDGSTSIDSLKAKLDEAVCGVMIQHPNFYGILEDAKGIGNIAKEWGVKYVIHSNPIALGVLKSQREYGADIAIGEGQPLGLPLSYGGPYLGYMATTKELVRKLPGRIVGETLDHDGNIAYVLTLQAREQHIRREKSLSNICSNQAHCALTASIYLAAMGEYGLKKVGSICMSNAKYLAERLCDLPQFRLAYSKPFFHEFVTMYDGDVEALLSYLEKYNILGGYHIKVMEQSGILWCTTELISMEQMDDMIDVIRRMEEEYE